MLLISYGLGGWTTGFVVGALQLAVSIYLFVSEISISQSPINFISISIAQIDIYYIFVPNFCRPAQTELVESDICSLINCIL